MAGRVRGFPWEATELGPIDDWDAILRCAAGHVLDSAFPSALVWGKSLITLYNDGFGLILGDRADPLGASFARIWSESWDKLGPLIDKAFAGRSTFIEDYPLTIRRQGAAEQAFFTFAYSPVRAHDGSVLGLIQTVVETTDAVTSRDRLRESELRSRTIVEGLAQATWETDARGDVVTDSPSWLAYTGQTTDEWRAQGGWTQAIHPDDRDQAVRNWRRAVATGDLLDAECRLRHAASGSWRWTHVRAIPLRGDDGSIRKWVGMNIDIDARKRAEATLRASEERQSLLLKLNDALQPMIAPAAIQAEGMRVLAEHLGAARAQYWERDPDGHYLVSAAVHGGAASAMPQRVPMRDWSPFFEDGLDAGLTMALGDSRTDPRLSQEERASCEEAGIRAIIGVPIFKGGHLAAALAVYDAAPRRWSDQERVLARAVADRISEAAERARAEAALRASEDRFRQFAASSSNALWIRRADTLETEYASPAFAPTYGLAPDEVGTDVARWAALIVPDDRAAALADLHRAKSGEAAVSEFRIQRPSDRAFRWIRDQCFPLRDESGRVERIGGIATDVTEAKLLAEHQEVLLAELQHRVRNIMAVIRSLAARSSERAGSVPEFAALLSGRLLTLARVQTLLTRAANVGVSLLAILEEELRAQALHDSQYDLAGPEVVLSPKAAEVLTLAVHELATNAVKYGAFSVPTGRVTIRWCVSDKRGLRWLTFDWSEQGAPPPRDSLDAPRRGFGSELIEGRIPYELGGRGEVTIEPGGARCRLEFPLSEGASILETDAPQRRMVFGGALDMTGEADLSGHRILVLEDDFYLATDTARAVQGAGATVLGPHASEDGASQDLAAGMPTAAVIDINLGDGPSFRLARELKERGVPFLFITGYDDEMIPPEFSDVPRLQKPVELRRIVRTLATTLGIA